MVYGAGLVIGGFTFPDLPDARTAWSEGLASLRFDLPRAFAGDGSAFGAPPAVAAEALWTVAVARAVARAAGAAFPSDADAAFARGARWLERIAGEIGPLPPVGDAPPAPVLEAEAPIAWSLWNLARAWGLADGEPAPGADADPRLAWLGVRAPGGTPEPAPKTWAMWQFREGGDAVAAMRVKNRPSRVVASFGPASACPQAHPAPLSVLWDVGDVAVLADPGCAVKTPALRTVQTHTTLTLDGREPPRRWDARLTLARVDGKKARITGATDAWSSMGFQHERDVLLNQARLLVTDRLTPVGRARGRHALRVAFQLGAGWTVEHDGTNWVAKNGALTLVVQLPATLAWSVVIGQDGAGRVRGHDGALVDAPCFVGYGGIDGETRFTASFEIR